MKTKKCNHLIATSSPAKGEAGKTGDWRINYPEIDLTKCLPAKTKKEVCFRCWLYCPEAVVTRTIPPKIDLDYCKGCGICAEECPSQAIKMIREK